MNQHIPGRPLLVAFLIGCLIGAGAFSSALRADPNMPAADRAVVAEEVRKELRRLLDEEGFMDQAIERGIESYIRKQRAAAAAKESRARAQNARKLRPVTSERDHVFGNSDASISLVEYSDFECPFCKRFHATAKELIEQNGGRVNWVYRHFPLAFHNPGAQKQAEASECAAELGGNDAFWRYSDLIYQRTTSNGNGFPMEQLVPLAQEIGLDEKAFADCLGSGRMEARVKEDYADGVNVGITGTPGMIFLRHDSGSVIATAGALPLNQLQATVNQLLSERSEEKP